jgi:Matrixin
MKRAMLCILIVTALTADAAQAQTWRHAPKVVVISPAGDSRLRAVDEAVAFWNSTLQEIGSGLRLGPVVRMVRPIPEEALQQLSTSVLSNRGRTADFPAALRDLPDDITIFLALSEFVSFASPFNENGKRIVGIRGASFPPMNLPNVARNVIAHELGHAIGLRHNSDPTTLMCGRPSPCRPAVFRSDQPRMFPLTGAEKSLLLAMYPSQWKSR